MAETVFGKSSVANELASVFKRAQSSALNQINTATLAKVISVEQEWSEEKKFGKLLLAPIPQWSVKSSDYMEGYFFSDFKPGIGNLVMLVFTMTDFRSIIESGDWSVVQTQNKNTHSKNFGVVIKL